MTRTIVNRCLNILFKQYFWTQHRFYSTKMTSLLVPPESVRGTTCLDRAAFTGTVELPFLKFHNVTISKVMPTLKKYLLKIPKFKSVQSTNNEVMIYLHPKLIQNFEDFKEDERKQLSEIYEEFGKRKLTFGYDNWNANDILKAILPEDIQIPSSYSIIGHIVHLNLKDMHLPYKAIIGQVLLDKTPTARTVVNKVNVIETTFRHFSMEILAGDKNTITVSKENGFSYELDFSKVYWNPRLGTEHANLITLMKRNDILYDIFAGVGPFAIPAARKGIKVFANDLNPESYKWLQKNVITNKVEKNIQCFNMDGRDFLRTIVKSHILNRQATNEIVSEHIVMNLPALAVEFLDVFFDWFNQDDIKKMCCQPPIIHVYCFVKANKGEDACKLGQLLVEEKLGCSLNSDSLINLHNVRNVSTSKEMIRVSFLLTENILKGEEPATKRIRIENNSTVSINDTIAENNGKEQGLAEKSKEQECFQSSNSS